MEGRIELCFAGGIIMTSANQFQRRFCNVFTIYGHMGMAAILFMWPWPFEQTFFPPTHGGSIWNLASIGPVVSEEKMFENVEDRWHTMEAYLYYSCGYSSESPRHGNSNKYRQHMFLWISKQNYPLNIAVFSGKTDVPHLPKQSMVMKM